MFLGMRILADDRQLLHIESGLLQFLDSLLGLLVGITDCYNDIVHRRHFSHFLSADVCDRSTATFCLAPRRAGCRYAVTVTECCHTFWSVDESHWACVWWKRSDQDRRMEVPAAMRIVRHKPEHQKGH